MHITRSRIQNARDDKTQNIHEFIEQKKEMFQAELAFNTVQFDDGDHNIDQMLDKLRSTI